MDIVASLSQTLRAIVNCSSKLVLIYICTSVSPIVERYLIEMKVKSQKYIIHSIKLHCFEYFILHSKSVRP